MIPQTDYEKIKNINVNDHAVQCNFDTWIENFIDNKTMLARITTIKEKLGNQFNRQGLVDFYKTKGIDNSTKFLAAMIWGYEAPSGGKRAGYGPSRVKTMFRDLKIADDAINSVSLKTESEIRSSYKKLSSKGVLEKCGPNFFTKHFYFLGKSQSLEKYPVIFDDRVANALFKLSLNDQNISKMIAVTTIRKADAYISFLQFIHDKGEEIGCEYDQLELYLFSKAAD